LKIFQKYLEKCDGGLYGLKNLNRTNKLYLSSIDRWMSPFIYPFPKLEIISI
jgi:hypothetical protein